MRWGEVRKRIVEEFVGSGVGGVSRMWVLGFDCVVRKWVGKKCIYWDYGYIDGLGIKI